MNSDKRVVPRGIPTVTYARILNPANGRGGDVLGDGSSVTILDASQASTRHDAAQVFNVMVSDQQFCESTIGQDAGATFGAHLNPVAAFVDDSATTVILTIGSKNSRKSQFLKKSFLPFLANELFACLSDKSQQLSGQDHYQSNLTLTTFEILDEVITDLLRPSTRGLGVSVTAEEGVTIHGLHKQTITSELQLRGLFGESCDNRASHTLPVGGSIDSSSAVWELHLHQVEGAEGKGIQQSHAKLVIVDIPCVDPLVLGASDLRQLEGPTLHKSLLSFVDVIGKLSSPIKAAYAPFRSSKLTHFLSELLGGNAIVIANALLHPGEPEVSRKSMELLEKLGSARHYPIANREMTDLVQGLLIKFRAMVIQLQDELNNGGAVASTDAQQESKEAIQLKIASLQQAVAESNLQEQLAKDDCTKLFEMLELMKEKYSTVMEQGAKQAEELIKSEEDKLSMARALVELKLLYNDLQEETEKEKFDSSSKILANKNEVFELDEAVQELKLKLNNTEEKLKVTEFTLEQEKEVGISTRASLVEVRAQLENESEKNIELSAELLTLVNQKEVLSSQLSESERNVTLLKKSNTELLTEATRLRDDNADLKANFVTAQEELVRVRQGCMLAEMEVKRAVLEKEQAKLEYERGANEILRGSMEQNSPMRHRDSAQSAGEDVSLISRALEQAEKKMLDLKIENESLNRRLKESADGFGQTASKLREEFDQEASRKRLELQTMLQEKFKKELKNQEELSLKRQEAASSVLKQHISILETENKKMREALLRRAPGTELSPGRKPAGGDSIERGKNYEVMQSIAYEDEMEDLKKANKSLKKRVTELERNAREIIIGEVNEIENRNSSLMARNALLEEELKQYRAYMKESIGKYKQQVNALRTQLADQSAVRGNSARHRVQMNVSSSVPEFSVRGDSTFGALGGGGLYGDSNASTFYKSSSTHAADISASSLTNPPGEAVTSFPMISKSSHRQLRDSSSSHGAP